MRIGCYPGSFDPFSFGHLEIANRAAPLFDQFHISIGLNRKKKNMFSVEERADLIIRTIEQYGNDDLRQKIVVDHYDSLLIKHVRSISAKWIVRGMRPVSDFDAEFVLEGVNHRLDESIETIFLMASPQFQFVSSSVARELATEHEDVSWLVPDFVEKAIHEKVDKSGSNS